MLTFRLFQKISTKGKALSSPLKSQGGLGTTVKVLSWESKEDNSLIGGGNVNLVGATCRFDEAKSQSLTGVGKTTIKTNQRRKVI